MSVSGRAALSLAAWRAAGFAVALPQPLLALLPLLHMLFGHKRGVQPPQSPPSTAAVFVSTPLSFSCSLSHSLSECPLCRCVALSTCLTLCFLRFGIGVCGWRRRGVSGRQCQCAAAAAAAAGCLPRSLTHSLSLCFSVAASSYSVHFLQGAVAVAIQTPSDPPSPNQTAGQAHRVRPCKRVGFSCPLPA